MKEKSPFDFERFKQEAIEGLCAGKKASGTDGVFAPLMKHLLESLLDGEPNNHLDKENASGQSNHRNGKSKKTVRSMGGGSFELETGRDRECTFEPKIVPKRRLIITQELEGNVLSTYAVAWARAPSAIISARCMPWRYRPSRFHASPTACSLR